MRIIVFGATGRTGQHVWRQALEQNDMQSLHVSNPYDGSLPYLDEQKSRICFNGPLEDAGGFRCIPALIE